MNGLPHETLQRYAIITEQFLSDDVLDSFTMAYRDEDSIFTKYMKRKYFWPST